MGLNDAILCPLAGLCQADTDGSALAIGLLQTMDSYRARLCRRTGMEWVSRPPERVSFVWQSADLMSYTLIIGPLGRCFTTKRRHHVQIHVFQ